MILMIKTENGKVAIDGFNRLETRDVDIASGSSGPQLDYRPRQKELVCADNDGVELELFRDDIFVTRVLSHRPVFLMNDHGETVDRL